MTDEELLRRSAEAGQLLQNPLLQEALAGLERGAVDALSACDVNDTKRLQTLALALQGVRAVKRRLELWVGEGERAALKHIEREERPRNRFTRVVNALRT